MLMLNNFWWTFLTEDVTSLCHLNHPDTCWFFPLSYHYHITIISCHVISYHIISYHITSYHIISYTIISYPFTSPVSAIYITSTPTPQCSRKTAFGSTVGRTAATWPPKKGACNMGQGLVAHSRQWVWFTSTELLFFFNSSFWWTSTGQTLLMCWPAHPQLLFGCSCSCNLPLLSWLVVGCWSCLVGNSYLLPLAKLFVILLSQLLEKNWKWSKQIFETFWNHLLQRSLYCPTQTMHSYDGNPSKLP